MPAGSAGHLPFTSLSYCDHQRDKESEFVSHPQPVESVHETRILSSDFNV